MTDICIDTAARACSAQDCQTGPTSYGITFFVSSSQSLHDHPLRIGAMPMQSPGRCLVTTDILR
jgi:hypothetical protein